MHPFTPASTHRQTGSPASRALPLPLLAFVRTRRGNHAGTTQEPESSHRSFVPLLERSPHPPHLLHPRLPPFTPPCYFSRSYATPLWDSQIARSPASIAHRRLP